MFVRRVVLEEVFVGACTEREVGIMYQRQVFKRNGIVKRECVLGRRRVIWPPLCLCLCILTPITAEGRVRWRWILFPIAKVRAVHILGCSMFGRCALGGGQGMYARLVSVGIWHVRPRGNRMCAVKLQRRSDLLCVVIVGVLADLHRGGPRPDALFGRVWTKTKGGGWFREERAPTRQHELANLLEVEYLCVY